MPELELWGGPECTVNRVRDGWFDQSLLSGHHHRDEDLELLAGIGFDAVRYPVLWERVAPDDPERCDWTWADRRLHALRELRIRPIAGLVHHGSGPRYTDLLDPEFPAKLGGYAAQVAERYPWIADWTPVNEPLTTARFSALYGHWHPHRNDEGAFWTALVNQVDGVRHAMRAVRKVNPAARLIQTDDLGRTWSTPAMAEQAGFDNMRRWAGWDLLFGRVTPEHPLWDRLAMFGLLPQLESLAAEPSPPDIVGVNHYLTSDRFLDHRVQLYPERTHGRNYDRAYADVEAIRVLDPPPAGLAGVLREAWDRYRTPMAVTEVHLGCTREEQLRWAAEAWDTARGLHEDGVDVRAVTAWAVFGSCGWNTLLTCDGVYEPGLFDISGGAPRPTALAGLWRGLRKGADPHPAARGAGWWRRPERLLHPAVRWSPRPTRGPGAHPSRSTARTQPLLICGATGTLGQAFARACAHRHIAHVLTDRRALDVHDPSSVAAALERHRPWAVVNATGWVRVDDAEADEAGCFRTNAEGAITLARAAEARGIPTLSFSSDLVFDGALDRLYLESDAPAPLNANGRSKAEMERAIAEIGPRHLVARVAAFFGPDDPYNFAAAVARELEAGRPFRAAADQLVSPTCVPEMVDRALDLMIDGAGGLWHLTHGEALSWADFARAVARACELDDRLVEGVSGRELGQAAPRPAYAALGTSRGSTLGPLAQAIAHFAEARRRHRDAASNAAA